MPPATTTSVPIAATAAYRRPCGRCPATAKRRPSVVRHTVAFHVVPSHPPNRYTAPGTVAAERSESGRGRWATTDPWRAWRSNAWTTSELSPVPPPNTYIRPSRTAPAASWNGRGTTPSAVSAPVDGLSENTPFADVPALPIPPAR